MKQVFSILLLLLSMLPACGSIFVWPDPTSGKLWRIDLNKRKLEALRASGHWEVVSPVTVKGVEERELPPSLQTWAFKKNADELLISINCTGQVYRFSYRTRVLERIDKTYYRGYNCWSFMFMRRDTLYSFGGYGFWHTNNIQTYYIDSKGEWECILPNANGPGSIAKGMNGYFAETDQYISTLNLIMSDASNKGKPQKNNWIYSYSFLDQKWRKLGKINKKLSTNITEEHANPVSVFQSKHLFICARYQPPFMQFFLLDPVKNQCRIWIDKQRLMTGDLTMPYEDPYRNFVWNDTLFLRKLTYDAKFNTQTFNKLAIDQLWQEAEPAGTFYEEESGYGYLYLLAILIVLIGLTGGILYHKKAAQLKLAYFEPVVRTEESLMELERIIVTTLLQTDSGLNSHQINNLLGIDHKQPENQRRIRNEFITSLNRKLSILIGEAEPIKRVPDAQDRRIVVYQFLSQTKQVILRKMQISSTISHK